MKRFKVSRRAFLGGAGAVLTLPMLESLMPRKAEAADNAPRRILAFYVPCGIHMAKWTPAEEGAVFTLPPILASLKPLQSKLLVLTGLGNEPARPDGPGDHASGTGAFMSVRHPVKTEGSDIRNGISMDQVAAKHLSQFTRIPSLQLGIDGGSAVGGCDSGYSCAYARNISWASETQPLPQTVNPQVVWDLLFDGFDSQATAAEKARRQLYRTSVLDSVLDEAKSLKLKLGSTDQRKLDEYMTGVNELEKKIKKASDSSVCVAPDRPPSNLPLQEHVKMMMDLIALGFQCDATRVVSFMLANAASNRAYPFLDVNEGHHEISHHQNLQENFDKLTRIDTWEVEQLAYLLGRLDAIEEADGKSVLDNSAVFFSSEIEDGNSHSHYNMPVLLAGNCGGAFSTGRHVRYEGNPSVANLFVSLLNAVGVTDTTFGADSTGPLSGLV